MVSYGTQCGILLQNIKEIHDTDKEMKYNKCDYTSTHRAGLRTHTRTTHTNARDMKCSKCVLPPSKSSPLKSHIKYVHMNTKDIPCGITSCQSMKKSNILNTHNVTGVHKKLISVHSYQDTA